MFTSISELESLQNLKQAENRMVKIGLSLLENGYFLPCSSIQTLQLILSLNLTELGVSGSFVFDKMLIKILICW